MCTLIMSNGEYGNSDWYQQQKDKYRYILCTDGAAAKARELNILPDVIVGDMDSIAAEDLAFMKQRQVKIHLHPPEKDFTDTFLALKLAEEKHLPDVIIWGGTGGRLDHTLANLFGCISFVQRGMRLGFDGPDLGVYMIRDRLKLRGEAGDTVSLFPMGEKVGGVTLSGFYYPLENAVLEPEFPIGVSNVLTAKEGSIRIDSGVLAVFHNKETE